MPRTSTGTLGASTRASTSSLGTATRCSPNRHDFERDEDYERALDDQFSCGRCGLNLSDLAGRSGTAAARLLGAGDVWGAGASGVLGVFREV